MGQQDDKIRHDDDNVSAVISNVALIYGRYTIITLSSLSVNDNYYRRDLVFTCLFKCVSIVLVTLHQIHCST